MSVITAIVNDWGRVVFLLSFTLLLCGCSKKTADPAEYIGYIDSDKNGLVQRKELDDIVYEVRYLSPEAMALGELRNLNPDKQDLKNVIKEYGQMAYFRVNIAAKDGHLFNALQAIGKNPDELEAYLNFDAEQDFSVRTTTDTVSCGLYSFSRTYGLSRSWQLMLAFDLQKWDRKSDLILSYNDKISQSGQLNFRFSGTDITNIPKLIY